MGILKPLLNADFFFGQDSDCFFTSSGAKSMKMRCGAGPLAVVAALFWTQCVLLDGVDAKKERKRPKEATPQHTETFNSTLSNSEELGGSVKVCDQLSKT